MVRFCFRIWNMHLKYLNIHVLHLEQKRQTYFVKKNPFIGALRSLSLSLSLYIYIYIYIYYLFVVGLEGRGGESYTLSTCGAG
jgi:hypothetical protein